MSNPRRQRGHPSLTLRFPLPWAYYREITTCEPRARIE
jgi:hypothetical protein